MKLCVGYANLFRAHQIRLQPAMDPSQGAACVDIHVEWFVVDSNLHDDVEQAGREDAFRPMEEPRRMAQWLLIVVWVT